MTQAVIYFIYNAAKGTAELAGFIFLRNTGSSWLDSKRSWNDLQMLKVFGQMLISYMFSQMHVPSLFFIHSGPPYVYYDSFFFLMLIL